MSGILVTVVKSLLITGAFNFIEQKLLALKREMEYNTVTLGSVNILLSLIDRTSGQKQNQQGPRERAQHLRVFVPLV